MGVYKTHIEPLLMRDMRNYYAYILAPLYTNGVSTTIEGDFYFKMRFFREGNTVDMLVGNGTSSTAPKMGFLADNRLLVRLLGSGGSTVDVGYTASMHTKWQELEMERTSGAVRVRLSGGSWVSAGAQAGAWVNSFYGGDGNSSNVLNGGIDDIELWSGGQLIRKYDFAAPDYLADRSAAGVHLNGGTFEIREIT